MNIFELNFIISNGDEASIGVEEIVASNIEAARVKIRDMYEIDEYGYKHNICFM